MEQENAENFSDALEHIRKKSAQLREEKYGEYTDSLISQNNGFLSPKMFHLFNRDRSETERYEIVEVLMDRMGLTDALTRTDLSYVYTQYRSYYRMLSQNIADFEGGSCSGDKALWVINAYTKKLLGKHHLPTDQVWNIPEVSTVPLWFDLITGFNRFNHGSYSTFIHAWDALQHQYQMKQ